MLKDLIMSMLSWMSEGLIFAKVMLIFSFHVYIAMMIFLERVGYLQIIIIVLFYPKYNNLIRKKSFFMISRK